jgi:hypothetical protein
MDGYRTVLRRAGGVRTARGVVPEVSADGEALTAAMHARIEPLLRALRAPLGESAPSELSFVNLLLFREVRGWRHHTHPLPYISGRSYDGSTQLLPLFDLATADPDALQRMQGEHGWFCPVASATLEKLDRARFAARAERDDADHLYVAEGFRDYAGAGLGSKRAAVERLHALHSMTTVTLDAASVMAAHAVLEGWCGDKGLAANDADAPACREALALLASADATGPAAALSGRLHLADEPAGFTICEEINPGVVVVRFAKGLRRFDGIFPSMYRHIVLEAGGRLRWLNFEQDLGRPNFRRSKMSFRPARLVPKHRVRVIR